MPTETLPNFKKFLIGLIQKLPSLIQFFATKQSLAFGPPVAQLRHSKKTVLAGEDPLRTLTAVY
jgi:hypothetical protein